MDIRSRLRGEAGAKSRIAEIKARIAALYPEPVKTSKSSEAGPKPSPRPLAGTIGSGYAPFNPVAAGIIRPQMAPQELRSMITRVAGEHDLDVHLLDALVASESSYNEQARSSAGAMGLTQLMPSTARALGVSDPFDPEQNLRGGAKYLRELLSRYNGDVRTALAAYNAGPGAVAKFGGVPPYRETEVYVERVMKLAEEKRAGQ